MKLEKMDAALLNSSESINFKLDKSISKYEESMILKVVSFLCVFILIGVMMYRLNRPTPWVVDDLIKVQEAQTIHSLGQMKNWAYNFYMHWGGRIWGEIFAQGFLKLPKTIFSKINTLGYLILLLLMHITIKGTLKLSVTLLLFIHFSLLVCLPAFGQDVLWVSGSANYLWASLFPILFFAFWRCYSVHPGRFYNYPLFKVSIFLIGIFAGWANENVSVALLFMGILYLAYFKMVKGLTPKFAIFGWVGLFAGSLLLWGAPGNFVRLAAEKHSKSFGVICLAILKNIRSLFDVQTALFLLIAFTILFSMNTIQKKKEAVIFLIGSIVATAAFSVIGIIHSRVYFGPIVLMTIATGILLDQYGTNLNKKKVCFFLSVLMLIGSYNIYQYAADGIYNYSVRWNTNQNIIRREKNNGNLDVYINPMPVDNKFCATYQLEDIKPERENKHWLNRGIARYFGLHTIQSVEIR